MDNKFYVSYEAARLLKEKGYNDTDIINFYNENGEMIIPYTKPEYSVLYPAPTKAEAIDWLESKGIIIEVFNTSCQWLFSIIDFNVKQTIFADEYYSTRLEAEEAAIIKACELLNTRPTF